MSLSFRTCEISTFEKSVSEQNKFLFDKDALIKFLNSWHSLTNYAFIYHDKDTDDNGITKDKHIHLMLRFKSPVPLDNICKKFGVQPSQVEKIKGRFSDALLYLTHRNKPSKHQYGDMEVVANFDFQSEIAREKTVKEAIYSYGRHEISQNQLAELISEKDYDIYGNLIKKMKEYRQFKSKKERNMKVVYITGSSGSGKTTLAKFLAISNGLDFFVSGSGNDPFDGYDLERCVILDDLRGNVFTKEQLFKLLDNNTESSVKSRYQNKVLSYCELMIITSVKEPCELYSWCDGFIDGCGNSPEDEPIKQFLRRLNYVFIRIEGWEVYSIKVNEIGKTMHRERAPFDMREVYSNMGIDPLTCEKNDTLKSVIFENVCKAIARTKK